MKMINYLPPLFLGVSLILSLNSCASQLPAPVASPAPIPASIQPSAHPVPAPLVLHRISFRLKLPNAFHTKQEAEPQYVKLEIEGAGATILAEGAVDGLVPIGDGVISADVPVGNNLTAVVGLYTNNDPTNLPILELGNAFHVADASAQGEVTLSTEGLLVANIVNELRDLESDELGSPINLTDYNAFAEQFLGNLATGETQENLNVNALASQIDAGSLDPNATTGGSTDPTHLELAIHQAAFLAASGRAGMVFPFPVNQSDKSVYLVDFNGSSGTVSQYGVDARPDDITTDANGHKFYPQIFKTDVTTFKSGALVSGQTNTRMPTPLGSTPPSETKNAVKGVTYSVVASAASSSKFELQARKQSDGSLAWSYNFNNTTISAAADNQFVPVLKRLGLGTSCLCDDEDMVLAGFSGLSGTDTGIHALQTGTGVLTRKWFYQYISPDTSAAAVFQNGALSADKSKLFALAKDSAGNAFLVAMNADTSNASGDKLWDVKLNGSLGIKPALALGTDGTIYIFNSQSSTAYLQAYDPSNGDRKWERQLTGAVLNASSPIVDRQNGADVVYAVADGKLYAYDSSGNAKWAAPVDLEGFKPFFAPLVGEEDSGRHVVYVMASKALVNLNNRSVFKIFAVTDAGEILWSRAPWSSGLMTGLNLLDGRLLFTTLDGGEGNFSQLQGIKVSTCHMPSAAPWPKIFGNLRNGGVPYPQTLTDDFLDLAPLTACS